MSIAKLWNHTVRVYREPTAEEARDEWGHVELLPSPLTEAPTAFNAHADIGWSGRLQDTGPGEELGPVRRWFLDKALDVDERDVLSVTAGPESGRLLRVVSVTRATGPITVHHTEVNVEAWTGDLGTEVLS